ncbi:MAG: hypothetical protein V7629_19260 [Motiliproteus sp.]
MMLSGNYRGNWAMRCGGFWLVVLLVSGCAGDPVKVKEPQSHSRSKSQSPSPESAVDVIPAGPSSPARQELVQAERKRIGLILALLDRADQAINAKRLTLPKGNNAMEYYRRVLVLKPGYEEARLGLEALVERYIEWSDAELRQGRLALARRYLQRARQVDPASAKIAQAAARLMRADGARQVSAIARYTRLDRRQLRVKSADLVALLGSLADRIRADNARVTIEAPTDSLGRWIYQQLNQRHEEYRIRANFRLEAQPGVRLFD